MIPLSGDFIGYGALFMLEFVPVHLVVTFPEAFEDFFLFRRFDKIVSARGDFLTGFLQMFNLTVTGPFEVTSVIEFVLKVFGADSTLRAIPSDSIVGIDGCIDEIEFSLLVGVMIERTRQIAFFFVLDRLPESENALKSESEPIHAFPPTVSSSIRSVSAAGVNSPISCLRNWLMASIRFIALSMRGLEPLA